MKYLFFLCLFFTPLFLSSNTSANQVRFMLHAGHTNEAIDLYKKYAEEKGENDFELLQELGISLLQEANRSRDAEKELLGIFGAGISTLEKTLPILEQGLGSQFPQIQLVALHFLAQQQNDWADEALQKALSSPYLVIRLEALHHLAQKKHGKALAQAEALMMKVDEELKPLFPKIFASIGSNPAIKILRKLLNDSNEKVRVEAILSSADTGRDDLLPQIRRLSSQHNNAQQEAAASALGMMKDGSSIKKMSKLAQSPAASVKIASLYSLYQLGQKNRHLEMERQAKEGNLFAIYLLGKMEGTQECLFQLSQNTNPQIRLNSALALLEKKDSRCLSTLLEIFLHDSRDLAFSKIHSQGGSLIAYKVIPSARQNLTDQPLAQEISTSIKEETLRKAQELPEETFLQIAIKIFETQQNDLVPLVVELLENRNSSGAIQLLQQQQQRIGAPLIRQYCALALYRMKIPGPYGTCLQDWLRKHFDVDMIRFKPLAPVELRLDGEMGVYQLNPEETSKLFVDTLQALCQEQDKESITILLDAIRYGNEKNKYALAGLLIRVTQ